MSELNELLEQRFISRILLEESKEMDQAQLKTMVGAGFRSRELLAKRHYSQPRKNELQYTHLSRHRFIDMGSRETARGRIRKKSHPIHNRILFGHANNVVRRLSFEYTSKTRDMLMKELAGNS